MVKIFAFFFYDKNHVRKNQYANICISLCILLVFRFKKIEKNQLDVQKNICSVFFIFIIISLLEQIEISFMQKPLFL